MGLAFAKESFGSRSKGRSFLHASHAAIANDIDTMNTARGIIRIIRYLSCMPMRWTTLASPVISEMIYEIYLETVGAAVKSDSVGWAPRARPSILYPVHYYQSSY